MKKFKTPKGTELPIMDIRGRDYLQVAFRLVWVREDHPDWSIVTEIIKTDDKGSTVKATISTPDGQILATAHKSETKQGFDDHLEKCETGAIGRALALCGYGTQFCGEELDEGKRLADSPLGRISPVSPDQPMEGDGHQVHPDAYIIPGHMGRLANKRPEDCDFVLLKQEVDRVKEKYKDKVPPPAAIKFISYCSDVLGNKDPTNFDNFQHQIK